MPYINVKTNVKAEAAVAAALKTELGKAIELFPGKTERWLAVEINDGQKIFFAGSDKPFVMAEVALFGKAEAKAYDRMTEKTTELLSRLLGVPSDRIYVKYEEIDHWGWNGGNF